MAPKIQDPVAVKNVEKPSLKYSLTPKVTSELDDKTAFSLIPDRVLLVEDVRFFTKCRVEELSHVEISDTYDGLCTNDKLDSKFEHIIIKGLTEALVYPHVFKPQWVKFVLSRVHDDFMWLQEQPIKITKEVIHLITRYPIYEHARAQKIISQKELISLTRVESDYRGLKFAIRVIGYCFFQSARENSVPCAVVDLAYKIVKKGMKVDLCEVLLKNLFENLNTIRKPKKNNSANTLKFGSLLVCMFFYFEKFFPSVGKVVWELHQPIC